MFDLKLKLCFAQSIKVAHYFHKIKIKINQIRIYLIYNTVYNVYYFEYIIKKLHFKTVAKTTIIWFINSTKNEIKDIGVWNTIYYSWFIHFRTGLQNGDIILILQLQMRFRLGLCCTSCPSRASWWVLWWGPTSTLLLLQWWSCHLPKSQTTPQVTPLSSVTTPVQTALWKRTTLLMG